MSDSVCLPDKEDAETACMSGCEDLAAMFRALGHPARIAILQRLADQREACCGEIVNSLPLAQSTVSQHLQVLKDAGLLTCDTRGRNCHYHLNWERLQQAEGATAAFWELFKAARHRRADGCAGIQDAEKE